MRDLAHPVNKMNYNMKRLLLLLNICAVALGALATQSCQDTPIGYQHYDGNRYSEDGSYYGQYNNGDSDNRGYYRADQPSIDVHL
jgi:hypothetical protein